jgi:hypothetical protein
MEQVAPGQAYNGTIQVTNTGNQVASISISLNDFALSEEGAFITLDPEIVSDHSLSPYISYSPESITLAPGESQEVHYFFTLPMDAVGPHWATLIVKPETSTESSTQPEEDGIALIIHYEFSFAAVIIQRPLNLGELAGQVVELDASKSTTEDGREVFTVQSVFENLCENIVECQARFEVRDQTGEAILNCELSPDRLVFPGTRRAFSYTFEDVAMPPGNYLVLCIVDFGGEHLVGAQYMATVGESP